MGSCALRIAPNPQSPIPNPQSPIPNPLIKIIFIFLNIELKKILMEDKNENKIPRLSLKSKNQLNFGIEYSNKISKLKVFIYGLKGVSLILIIYPLNI
jgi:hypothetical protein